MGIGHYHVRDGATVFVGPYEGLPEFDESIRYLWDDAWQALEDCLYESLSPRFWWESGRVWRDDARVVARSRLHDVTLHEDSYGYAYVTVRPREDLDDAWQALASGNLEAVADRLFGGLARAYPLRRGSGWTSSPYEPGRLAA